MAAQTSGSLSPATAGLDAGAYHTCAVLVAGSVRCWGFGADGQLGYANTGTIGDDETPGSVGPVNLGMGHTAEAVVAGDFHTCALLEDATVRCWGFGGNGRLGYGNVRNVTAPGSIGPVDLGRPATAITAGSAHTCALLADGSVRCWGYGGGGFPRDGRLGYGNTDNIGDDESPGSVGPVQLGVGRKAIAISAGGAHTCALLDDNTVRCWGRNDYGQLGYANTTYIGDDETPDARGPVKLGFWRSARAISAGGTHTCALLDDATVRCWGRGDVGELGYGNQNNVGDDETPDAVGPVNLGFRRSAVAISAGGAHTCALLDDATVRCWGDGGAGRLGYGNQDNIGENETPDSAGPVDLGRGRTVAISSGRRHTCVRLDDAQVRCWGYGANGRLGLCSVNSIGDDESPGSVGPVDLGEPGGGGARCANPPSGGPPKGGSATTSATGTTTTRAPAEGAEALRASGLRRCLVGVARRARRLAASGRRRCLHDYGRTPGRVTRLQARAVSRTQVRLSLTAPGTNGPHPPPARSYLVKQSSRQIRSARDFHRAKVLCKGHCRFTVRQIGARISLTVTDLRPHTRYYFAVAARDNVSARRGPRSQTATVRTR